MTAFVLLSAGFTLGITAVILLDLLFIGVRAHVEAATHHDIARLESNLMSKITDLATQVNTDLDAISAQITALQAAATSPEDIAAVQAIATRTAALAAAAQPAPAAPTQG